MFAYSLRLVTQEDGKAHVNSIPELLLVFSVFTKELASRTLLGIDFDYIAYPFAILYFLFHFKRIVLSPATPHKLFLYITLSSLFSIFYLGLAYGGFVKQIFPILIIFSVNFFVIYEGSYGAIFRLYVKFAYYSAIFGLIQVLLSFAGINILIKIPGRLDSIAYEPSHYAAILLPALIFTFFHFKEYTRYFLVMLVALVFTFNLTGYLVFTLVIGFAYINPLYFLFSLPVLYYLVFHVIPNFNVNFQKRIFETLEVFSGNTTILTTAVNANGTTISLYSNLMVAEQNVKDNFIAGSGLGGHEETYHRFYEGSLYKLNYYYGLNAKSGHSLTIRVLSEFGLVGFVLYVITFVRKLILLDNGIFRSISLGCLSHFLCKTFKLGGIIDYGTPFFFAMLFLNYQEYRMSKK